MIEYNALTHSQLHTQSIPVLRWGLAFPPYTYNSLSRRRHHSPISIISFTASVTHPIEPPNPMYPLSRRDEPLRLGPEGEEEARVVEEVVQDARDAEDAARDGAELDEEVREGRPRGGHLHLFCLSVGWW